MECGGGDVLGRIRGLQSNEEIMVPFETVWRRIKRHDGEVFVQIRGGKFKYAVIAGALVPDRTNQQIPKSHFRRAMKQVPLKNTVPLQDLRGPSYIYAVLMDDRIRGGDW